MHDLALNDITEERVDATVLAGFQPSRLCRIRALGPDDAAAMAAHLLALPPPDRHARFNGMPGEAMIRRFCAALDPVRDIRVGAFGPDGAMIGAAIACRDGADRVEVAVSVSPGFRRRGLGAALV
ncbi:MAG: GNAT family N-acetyltransferase, partial [Acetobacteraceae bacterium]|nr:GNAT family N-acetyltransferase [Acetobacteraceae bacterium]